MSTNIEGVAGAGRATAGLRNALAALGHELAARMRRLWEAYWDRQARRATALMLEALDDRTLKDIGLSRDDIRPTVFGERADRVLSYDPLWWRRAGRGRALRTYRRH
jgi:uncharacterized protein YjiS (DUF1127 family)